MIRYRHLVKLSFETSNPEVVNIFTVTLHDHNYWPYPKPNIKQSGYCHRPLNNDPVEMHFFFYLQFFDNH